MRLMVMISCFAAFATACGVTAAGDAETDRQSETLADAISYPRQPDAAGLARAALATPLGKGGTFSVLEARDLDHKGPEDPMALLVWRIHRDKLDAKGNDKGFDACYTVEFDFYGPSSGPSRIDCPDNAEAITPAPEPRRDIPPEYAPALEAVLGKLPATVGEADVRAALESGLPAPKVDPATGLAALPPQVFVHVKGSDVGVALFAQTGVESKDCVMGHRLGGVVKVWTLNWRDLSLMEKSCGAQDALTAG
ncbi:hypothetical protein [Actinokineospora sp. HUAS TT18]|uniref:hypothetical protein n=1 Tax=Actinokineospora sp. HUAS TT18 TaxID=3447451 RepID=UPI003F5260B6